MRLRTTTRLGAALAAVLCILALLAPPTSATGRKTLAFAGTATLAGGLDYPCAETVMTLQTGGTWTPGETTPTKGDKDCPAVPTLCPDEIEGLTPVPGTPEELLEAVQETPGCFNKKGKLVETGGNTRAGTFTSAGGGCGYGGTAAGKQPDKTEGLHAGLCTITASFVVTGYCGLSQGRGQGRITFTELIGSQTDAHFKFTFVDPAGGHLLILGNYWYGTATPPPAGTYAGDIVAFVKATPLPTVPPGGNSCTNKTARFFDIEGEGDLSNPKCIPGHEEPGPNCLT